MTTRMVMHGAAGRMGRRILALALEAPETYTVLGGVDTSGGSLRDLGLASDAPLSPSLPKQPGAVVIDFSHPSATPLVVAHCMEQRMPLVLGTTGHSPEALSGLLGSAGEHIPVLTAANFSLGVNLVLGVAAQIAKSLGLDYDIEITEAHHHHKVDAPSGTALAIADSILAATGRTRADLVHGREGQVGARKKGEIGLHALRMGDVVGDHRVWFVGGGERIELAHTAHSRDIFARGALTAATWLASRPPGRYSMANVLGW